MNPASEHLIRTPLYERHVALNARIVPFAGHAMPVQYASGALREYQIVRGGGAGIFDISHMGQIRVSGPEAMAFLQHVTTNDVSRLADGQVHYSALLNEQGTFIDDITTYRLHEHEFYLCVNAANRGRDARHLLQHAAGFDVRITDESEDTALIALQGAASQDVLQPLADIDLDAIAYYRFAPVGLLGRQTLISRTGYTGEDGFEIYMPADIAPAVWDALLEQGAHPAGLAARDMLRTEMGYALYGHEIDDTVTPVEAGLMWITKLDKGHFIGREAVLARKQEGAKKRLIALELVDRGIPRERYPVLADGQPVGEVTSGMFSPSLQRGIALAYVQPAAMDSGGLAIEIRGRAAAARLARLPFVPSRVRK